MATALQNKTSTVLKQFVGGKWVEGTSGREFTSTNPADTRDVIASFQGASKMDALKTIEAAEKAAPVWRNTPAPKRGRILAKALEIARSRKQQLGELLTREEGKILVEGLGEIEKGLNLIEWFSGEGMRFMGTTAPSELPKNLLYTVRQPLGVVSIITPWNFPWAIPCWKIAPALVAGNAVIFKPASNTPALAMELVKIFEEAGLPPGVLNLVMGAGSAVGDILVEDTRIKAVSFTGSNSVGKNVHKTAGERGIKVTCEMGGKNPCIVWDDADLSLALPGVVMGAFGSTGQRCTATSRLILHEKIADKFLGMVTEAASKLTVGAGLDPQTKMGPVVDQSQLDTVMDYIKIAKEEGAKLVFGGGKPEGAQYAHGFFVQPTIFDAVLPAMRIFQEEVFGPVLSVTRVKTFDEAMDAANNVEFGLTSAIYTQDISTAMSFVDRMEAGMVHVNSPTIGGEAQVPFGGVKGSGVGEREMAKEGVNFFSEPKTVFLDYTGSKRESNVY